MNEWGGKKDRYAQKEESHQPKRRSAPPAAENGKKATRTGHQGTAPGVRIVAKKKRKSNMRRWGGDVHRGSLSMKSRQFEEVLNLF